MTSGIAYAQYQLYVFETEYLQLSDPPMDGYIENAWWNCDKADIYFKEADEVGAIIYPEHYFEGTAIITCDYYYSYFGYDGNMHAANGSETFYVTCVGVKATLEESYIEVAPGKKYTISYHLDPSNYRRPTPVWSSNRPEIASVDDNGVVHAHEIGVTRIMCDPIIGPLVFCEVRVCENPSGDDEDNDDENDNNGDNTTEDQEEYGIEYSIKLIEDLKSISNKYLPN